MTEHIKLTQAPLRSTVLAGNILSANWAGWFARLHKILTIAVPSISEDNGDANVTVRVTANHITQRFATPLTANRTVTLSTVGVYRGARFRIVREAGATGAFNLDVGGLKTLTTAGQWCDVEYGANGWILTASGTL